MSIFDTAVSQRDAELAERALIDAQRRWMLVQFFSTREDHGASIADLADVLSGKVRVTNWPADGFCSSGLHYDPATDGFLLRVASATFARVPVGSTIPVLVLLMERQDTCQP